MYRISSNAINKTLKFIKYENGKMLICGDEYELPEMYTIYNNPVKEFIIQHINHIFKFSVKFMHNIQCPIFIMFVLMRFLRNEGYVKFVFDDNVIFYFACRKNICWDNFIISVNEKLRYVSNYRDLVSIINEYYGDKMISFRHYSKSRQSERECDAIDKVDLEIDFTAI